MIFTDYWKDLVLNFSVMGNAVIFWVKKLMERWNLLVTETFLFWTFRWCSQKVDGKMIFTWSFWTFHDILGPRNMLFGAVSVSINPLSIHSELSCFICNIFHIFIFFYILSFKSWCSINLHNVSCRKWKLERGWGKWQRFATNSFHSQIRLYIFIQYIKRP